MIVAHMATYPPRWENCRKAIASIAPQVDALVVVFNEYQAIPSELTEWPNVRGILPEEDLKDTGKYLPEIDPSDWVFTVDDDIAYPEDYVARSLRVMESLGPGKWVGGYHASYYRRPFKLPPPVLRALFRSKMLLPGLQNKKSINMSKPVAEPLKVDQLGTGTVVAKGAFFPPFERMKTSQKFVDVRFSAWCHAEGITRVCLPRPAQYFTQLESEETIATSFTKNWPRHVREELASFACGPGVGRVVKGATP